MARGGLFLLLPRLCPGDGPFQSLKQKHAGHLPSANHGTTEQTHPTGLIKERWGSTWGFPTGHKRRLFVLVNLFQARVISCWEAGCNLEGMKVWQTPKCPALLGLQHRSLPLQNTKQSHMTLFIS